MRGGIGLGVPKPIIRLTMPVRNAARLFSISTAKVCVIDHLKCTKHAFSYEAMKKCLLRKVKLKYKLEKI